MAKKIQRRDKNVNKGGKQNARQSVGQRQSDKHEAMDEPEDVHDKHEEVNDGKQGSGQSVGQQKSKATDDSPLEQTYRKTDKPTLPTLIWFKCCDGSHIDITEEIGAHHLMFGILLRDETGAKVNSITQEHRENPNLEIFRLWLSGAGLQPVSWKTLVDVLKAIKLNVLADKISTAKAF